MFRLTDKVVFLTGCGSLGPGVPRPRGGEPLRQEVPQWRELGQANNVR